jgi:DTW domain-containing protein YfiP
MNFVQKLKSKGLQGDDLFQSIATHNLNVKKSARKNRCPSCWHDSKVCICAQIPKPTTPRLPVKILILMHYKEYYNAGNDAKLLLQILPHTQCELFIFGIAEDWTKFQNELTKDPVHTMLLWPCDESLTVNEYLKTLPNSEIFQQHQHVEMATTATATATTTSTPTPTPTPMPTPTPTTTTLRVVVLDGVFNHANSMFRSIRRRLPSSIHPPPVALHPSAISIYHRAKKNYAAASAKLQQNSKDPQALRICTVEAVALLLSELGEIPIVSESILQGLRVNNAALKRQNQLQVKVVSIIPEVTKEEKKKEDEIYSRSFVWLNWSMSYTGWILLGTVGAAAAAVMLRRRGFN